MESNNRPYFSILIPCYNCRNTIEKLLNSIFQQVNEDGFTTEIIICDDNSTDNFLELVEPYKNKNEKITIKICKTDVDFHCPGNTRKRALAEATGVWLTSADNDDFFELNAFQTVKRFIEENNIKYMLSTDFREWSEEKMDFQRYFTGSRCDTWTHGKWFNLDNLIKKFNINYKDNMFSHEDVYFNSSTLAHLIGIGEDYIYIPFYSYRWVANPNSLSRKYFSKTHVYIEEYLCDYLTATSEPFYAVLDKYPKQWEFYMNQILMGFLHGYFYYESFRYKIGSEALAKNQVYLHDYKNQINEKLKMNDSDIINYIYSSPQKYNNIKLDCAQGSYPFIETQSFRDFVLNI